MLSETSNNNSFNACEYTYDSDGNITEIEYPNITVQYTYDSEGRIETKSTSGSIANNQHFYYDSKGQIIRCDDSRRNQTTTFEYDSRGNLTKRNFYAYTTGEITENTSTTAETEYTFDYDDNVWIDGVEFATDNVAYNDNIIYDENGNPLNIDYQEFEWTNGRQLKSITYHFTDGTSKKGLEYTYDENGLRTSKNFGIYKYDYIYDGDKLIAELKTDPDNGNYQDRKEYFYDGNDEVIGFTRRNGQDTYFYLKDAEGNIIGFTDGNGNVQGLYDYDAWGKVSHRYSASWENPLTYRGYYYDDENMVYYLQSRYYNPQWGRFLNADIPEIAQQSKDEINGLNLFAYCTNDPVNNSDPTGKWTISINDKSIKVSGKYSKPKYEPLFWNSLQIKNSTNCYAYALNIRTEYPIDYKLQPGAISGSPINNGYFLNYNPNIGAKGLAKVIKKAFKADLKKLGMKYIRGKIRHKKEGHLVALVICYNSHCIDYHWYREDSKKSWSHKPGHGIVTNLDAKGNRITNPKKANRNYGNYLNYSYFVGYFRVGVKA